MNRNLNNRTDFKKKKTIMVLLFLMFYAFWDAGLAPDACAEMERLNKEELAAVTGAGGVDFSIIGNTARIYFDVHMETYAEIDSLKLGYYQRENLTTRKYLDPDDPMVVMSRHDGPADDVVEPFWLYPYVNGSGGKIPVYLRDANGWYRRKAFGNYWDADPPGGTGYSAPATKDRVNSLDELDGAYRASGTFHPGDPEGPYDAYAYSKHDGTSAEVVKYIPYTDNDNYQMKWNNTLSAYVEGAQGENNPGALGNIAGILGPGTSTFSQYPTTNGNNMDWDINIENLRFGTSPDNPMVIDGLVMHLKYDDITSPNKKLTDIIIGTNSMEGNFFGDIIRATGYLNPKLPHKSRYSTLNLFSFIDIFNEAPVPVSLKRDSFLYMVDHYRASYEDLTPGKDDNIYYAIPEDPTNNDIHTGFFLRLGLDPNDEQHFGYSLIAGYNELIANAYEPTQLPNQHIQDALNNWWNN